MKDAAPQTFHLSDYTPFGWIVEDVHLTFRLAPSTTRVLSRIRFAPNPDAPPQDFFLHGEDLKVIRTAIDGQEIAPELTETGLMAEVPAGPFTFEAEVEIDPKGNTALEGLYLSNGMFCTQCEAEGFRKITFYPDRPDVMARFTVRIESVLPVLLSNGNPGAAGEGFAEWHDPWPKPAYLFALVAADLVAHRDRFVTMEGRAVDLAIWVRPSDEGKCAWGMESLKRSMTWDEEVYGRAYDLDVFNIVAVDDFNMGAMENKGLNIFNSSCVLASPETATDANFERIEAIVAHEYFHNWTGNRISCRDWFQLCLKEGLTVFRDQQFTSDLRSAAVKRIEDAQMMRARQFPEDMGPLSHPVRPESYQEINNFYTATVYEKGAEVIGMLKRLVGEEGYKRALDLYFTRHDGDAATIEDWLKVFEDATGRDLTQFKRWYSQSGTPRLTVEEAWEDGTYTLTFRQDTAPTPGQPDKKPQVIPIAVGLLSPNGDEVVPTRVLEMTEAKQSFAFEGLSARPIPSILRDFSAPVMLDRKVPRAERAFLLAHDTDPFNRWDAARGIAMDILTTLARGGEGEESDWIEGIRAVLRDDTLDPAFRARIVALPGEAEIARTLSDAGHTPDPDAIRDARESFRQRLAEALHDIATRLYAEMQPEGPYSPEAGPAGMRALSGAMLGLLSRIDGGAAARALYARADNMTQTIQALSCLLDIDKGAEALADFEKTWRHDRLVMDKWFALQVAHADDAAATAQRLAKHRDFDMTNPNRFRAVFSALAGNHAGFHAASGAGYDLMADRLIALDALNPQTAARMATAFQSFRRYDADRQDKARAALTRIARTPGLSRDTSEMVTRLLA